MEARNCQNCKEDFVLGEQETGILNKLRLPHPSFCSRCAMMERMLWRNERSLYKHPNQAPGASGEIISMYAPDSKVPVYDSKSWWGDEWDAKGYGQDYDFSKSFFEQFDELIRNVPFPALQNWNAVNSDYCNCTTDNKNCYMVFGGDFNEDCMYSMYNIHSKNLSDVYWAMSSEYCYELVSAERCYRVAFGQYVRDCADSSFLYNCVNCSNCIGCVGLRNKSNCILNVQYTKEEFASVRSELKLATHEGIDAFRNRFELLRVSTPVRFAYLVKTENVTGDRITNAKNCANCFDIVGPAEDLADCYISGWNAKDMLRTSNAGYGTELIYNSFGVFSAAQRVICSAYTPSSFDVSYSYNCPNGSYLFGCVGMQKGNYMILNKQYSKEEYESLIPKIIEHMNTMPYRDSKGRTYVYGDFFPGELSMFAYNESVAQDILPKNEKEIGEAGYRFYPRPHSLHSITVPAGNIPDSLPKSYEEISQAVFECANKGEPVHCTGAFRINREEYDFYSRIQLPLPKYCFNCRHYARFAKLNPFVLQSRVCQCAGRASSNALYANAVIHTHGDSPCPVEFQTTYQVTQPEIVYCEHCYQQEIQ